jgi:hypothetical protein
MNLICVSFVGGLAGSYLHVERGAAGSTRVWNFFPRADGVAGHERDVDRNSWGEVDARA